VVKERRETPPKSARHVEPSREDRTPALAAGTRDHLEEQALAARRAALDDDVAGIAHDLKNSLSVILLEAGQLELRLGLRVPPAVQRGLQRIARNAAFIDRLVGDLIDAAAAEANQLEIRPERIDLNRLIHDAIRRAVPSDEHGRVQIEARAMTWVEGDAHRLERVVSNLVSNALKYSGPGLPVTVRLETRGARACVSVFDRGPGLTSEEARRVFDRYQRAGGSQQPGYGLGLFICRKIVEAHRGRIGVASTPGRGSRFFFDLPRLPA
jgi:signal transduction histidine kinase